jgi:RNA polymerase sigma-70 factor, ECF subfamily
MLASVSPKSCFAVIRKMDDTHSRGARLQSGMNRRGNGRGCSGVVTAAEVVPRFCNEGPPSTCSSELLICWRNLGTASSILKKGRMDGSSANITGLLRAASSGDRQDVDALMSAIYADLRRIANSQLHQERPDHTLQPTALVHEAYLKLIDQRTTDWKDRAHFFSIAARVIRRILVDHAREKRAQKRGGAYRRIELETSEFRSGNTHPDLIELDDSLQELAVLNARQAQIVEMRFFGGLTLDEIAGALGIGRRSVDREWATARAWLYVRLAEAAGD